MFNDLEIIFLSQEYSSLQEPASFLLYLLKEARKLKSELSSIPSSSSEHLKVLFAINYLEKFLEQVLVDVIDPHLLHKYKLQCKVYLAECKSNSVNRISIESVPGSSISRF